MSNREFVIELVKNLPEDTTLQEIAREVELVAGIREAQAEAARGEGVSAEAAKELVALWASR